MGVGASKESVKNGATVLLTVSAALVCAYVCCVHKNGAVSNGKSKYRPIYKDKKILSKHE